jgi:Flp pilus assembly protein TadB
MYGKERNYMKILLTILGMVTLLVLGFSFLSSGVNNKDNNVSKRSVRKTQNDEYHSKFKRRDFIRERRESERKELNRAKSARQVESGRYHDDFMAYNRVDSGRNRYDDFK